jgi:hypothetical protein
MLVQSSFKLFESGLSLQSTGLLRSLEHLARFLACACRAIGKNLAHLCRFCR